MAHQTSRLHRLLTLLDSIPSYFFIMWFCFWFDFPSLLWVGVGMGEKGGVGVMGFVALLSPF